MKYVTDDSTIFWAVGPDSGVIARHSEFCGKEVEMVLPFDGVNAGQVQFDVLFFNKHIAWLSYLRGKGMELGRS